MKKSQVKSDLASEIRSHQAMISYLLSVKSHHPTLVEEQRAVIARAEREIARLDRVLTNCDQEVSSYNERIRVASIKLHALSYRDESCSKRSPAEKARSLVRAIKELRVLLEADGISSEEIDQILGEAMQ
jgi:superfamily I DNA and RNA helicase